MKVVQYISIFALIIGLSVPTFAQVDAFPPTESSNPTSGLIKSATKDRKDRIIFNFTHENWSHEIPDANGVQFQTKWFSRGFSMGYMHDIQIKKSKFSVAPGLVFTTKHVYHNGVLTNSDEVIDSNGTVTPINTPITLTPLSESAFDEQFRRTKVASNYLEIPVELRFRGKPSKKGFAAKFALGMKFGVRLNTFTKTWEKNPADPDDIQVVKVKRFEEFNRYEIGPTIRVGYGPFNLIGFYGLTRVIENDLGPQINSWSVGIQINGL